MFATDVITGGPNYLLSYLDIPTDADGLPEYKGPYTGKGQDALRQGRHLRRQRPSPTTSTSRGRTSRWRSRALHMMDPYREDKDKGDKSNYQIFSNGPYKLDGEWNKN